MSVEPATHALMAWLVAGRDPQAAPDGSLPYRRRCFWVLLTLYLCTGGLGATILAVGLLSERPSKDGPLPMLLVGGAFLLLTLFAAADLLAARVTLAPEGIDFRYPWRPGAFVPWSEVRSVTYSPGMYWFPVQTDRGTYRISELRDGLGTFREHLERHVPLEVWAPVGALLP